jgi:phthiocerol/phenolphthiocerol synthesis type-I polyketide synthase E
MPEISSRLARLTPEKRHLLQKLVNPRSGGAPAQPQTLELPATMDLILGQGGATALDPKGACRDFYDAVSCQLDASIFGDFSIFLNYGYVSNLNPQFAAVDLPEAALNRNSVKLVLELVEDCVTLGSRVLDVGCGRGGTVSVMLKFFQPGQVVGLDLSAAAIAFCRRTHRYPEATFLQGDSEHLPFQPGSFDIVTNLESSSCYPDIYAFYSEVARVLTPGGYFLYSDCLPIERLKDGIQFIMRTGFTVERDRDITSNVLASCDQIAKARAGAYQPRSDNSVLDNFLGTPGSQYYEEMQARRWAYRILKLRKTT